MTARGKEMLVVDDLSVHLPAAEGTVRAVDRVSFSVAQGKTLALVGESGSGKSMLCRAVMGLLPRRAEAPGGSVVLDGRELTRMREKDVARIRGREMGMVLQNPMSSLNPVLTIGRQIAEPMLLHLGISRREARQRSLDLLDAVGIARPDEMLDRYPHQFSGGMRQRVAIAMAISCDPKLLIADEPTTALDVTVQAEILNLLGRLQRERDMAMILVTHDLGIVAGRAQETAVMYAGRIVELAATADLFDVMSMPYTKGLFDSIPRLDAPPNTRLSAIEGRPPDLAARQQGCSFAPRCGQAVERCRIEEPPLTDAAEHRHRYACWFPISKAVTTEDTEAAERKKAG